MIMKTKNNYKKRLIVLHYSVNNTFHVESILTDCDFKKSTVNLIEQIEKKYDNAKIHCMTFGTVSEN